MGSFLAVRCADPARDGKNALRGGGAKDARHAAPVIVDRSGVFHVRVTGVDVRIPSGDRSHGRTHQVRPRPEGAYQAVISAVAGFTPLRRHLSRAGASLVRNVK
jgi:hypothetical protein